MIYIIQKTGDWDNNTYVESVYEAGCKDVKLSYNSFMAAKAEELHIVINPHHLNIMDFKRHNSHLSETEYRAKEKHWKKTLKEWDIERYISEVLKGKKLEFKNIYR